MLLVASFLFIFYMHLVAAIAPLWQPTLIFAKNYN